MTLKKLEDLEVSGRRVLVRTDYNVLVSDGAVTDNSRIQASLPTIRALLSAGATVICCSHLGRPGGKVDPSLSLLPVGRSLATALERRVRVTESPVGPSEDLQSMEADEVALLENLRFDPREETNDAGFAGELASLAEAYVGDAFGVVHRAHASVMGVPSLLPSAAGLLVQKEVEILDSLLGEPERPFIVVLGGAKVADKIGVVRSLVEKADLVLVGGAMANTFLAANGVDVADSRVERDRVGELRDLMDLWPTKIEIPQDVIVGEEFSEEAAPRVSKLLEIPEKTTVLDIGPKTAQSYAERIAGASTVFWNGPMGVFEWVQFSMGTRSVAVAIANCSGTTVVGGGESGAAMRGFGLVDSLTHLSTGGGASLEYLSGKTLPGIEALTA